MYLANLTLSNYKNIEQVDIECSPSLNCFAGANGEGKTNLLDGIYYLSMCKSKFATHDTANIRNDEDYFMLKGKYMNGDEENCASCGIKRNGKKSFKYNSKEYRKLSEHIGVIPLVFITPSDVSLITGGSDERRNFANAVISQTDKPYLDALLRYNNALHNRNKTLKNRMQNLDFSLLDTLGEQMSFYGQTVYEKRKAMIETFTPVFQEIYTAISGSREQVKLSYRSDLDKGNLKSLLDANLDRDCLLQFTSTGVHRDDLVMELNGRPLKNAGSQGQQKTYLVAMKLTQFRIIDKGADATPILLLDDIFDKLDTERVERLVALVSSKGFGQIFITDCNKNRLDKLLQQSAADYRLFSVVAGNVALLQSSVNNNTANLTE
jgi:DNA replication and repair protein RecF